jgi:hypothetical protein
MTTPVHFRIVEATPQPKFSRYQIICHLVRSLQGMPVLTDMRTLCDPGAFVCALLATGTGIDFSSADHLADPSSPG